MPSNSSLRFPSPPPAPCPWLWRCHACHIWYRLATTRRCLECDHEFCLSDPSTTSAATRSQKRRRAGGPCRSEFDYIGWAARGAWRRTKLLNTPPKSHHRGASDAVVGKEPLPTTTTTTTTTLLAAQDDEGGLLLLAPCRSWLPQRSFTTSWGDEHRALERGIEQLTDRFAEKKEALFVRRRHNCWLHCDFPSECHHAVYKAQQEGKPVLAKARAVDRAYLTKIREEQQQQQQQQQQQREGPSGLVKKGGFSSEKRGLQREVLMCFAEESSDENDNSDDSEAFDHDDNDDISLPSSPPTEDEVQDPTAVSPLPASDKGRRDIGLDLESDYSYTTFKKAAGIVNSMTTHEISSSSAPANTQTFETYADDEDDVVAEFVSPDTTSASENTSPTKNPATSSFASFEPFWTVPRTATFSSSRTNYPASHERSTAPLSPVEEEGEVEEVEEAFITTTTLTTTPTLQQLEQAYSAQAWFSSYSSSSSTTDDDTEEHNNIPKTRSHRHRTVSSSRAQNTARMLTLLGRRTTSSTPPATIATTTNINVNSSSVFEDWEDDDDESNTTTATRVEDERVDVDVDGDGDRYMLD